MNYDFYESLGDKDKRALKIGAAAAVLILVYSFGSGWVDKWAGVRKDYKELEKKLASAGSGGIKQEGLRDVVPVFELPAAEDEQQFLFRDKLNEQLKKCGIKSKPLEIVASKKGKVGYRLLYLKCSSDKCKFDNMLELLAELKGNEFMVGVEEFEFKCGKKKREEVEMKLTVSTFVR